MKKNSAKILTKSIATVVLLILNIGLYAQTDPPARRKSDFWEHVQFGGGFGLSLGSGFTDVTIAPSGIYNLNHFVSIGAGLQGSFVSQKDLFSSTIYGVNAITLFNPVEEVQISLEVEQVRVNNYFEMVGGPNKKVNFWNTGLFVGGGYRMDNVTVGMRYNLLYNKDNNVYSDALMPFVRMYF